MQPDENMDFFLSATSSSNTQRGQYMESRQMTLHLFVRRSAASIFFGIAVVATPAIAQDRGELLYSTHCLACHTKQLHWRTQKAVTDWPSLQVEVRKWQGYAMLEWRDDDVVAVARYLNDSTYHFVVPSAMEMRTPAAVGAIAGRLPGLQP